MAAGCIGASFTLRSCLRTYPRLPVDNTPGLVMARTKTTFVCQACGAVTPQWQGRCESCGEWNTIVEELVESGVGAGPKSASAAGRPIALVPLAGETETAARVVTGMGELDRVTGGGFVKGSAVLVG